MELDPATAACPMCGSTSLRRFQAQAFDSDRPALVSITECEKCTFAWQYPLARTELESVAHFDKNYKQQGVGSSQYFDLDLKNEIAALEMAFVSSQVCSGKRLLDLGAGAGVFAKVAASAGWSVTAVDPALEVERIKDLRQVTAIRGLASDLPDEMVFDVITMWDVIEHLPRPVQGLMEARDRLAEGGWLILGTGNYMCADRVKAGDRHWIYQLDHRWYFSPLSLERLGRKIGFSDIIFAQRLLRPGWNGHVGYVAPTVSGLLKSMIKRPLRARAIMVEHAELKKAQTWPLAGLGIFAIAMRR